MTGYTLPPGWTAETLELHKMLIISTPAPRGSVSVDFQWRRFELGIRSVRPGTDPTRRGRGWRAQLVTDAVTALAKAAGLKLPRGWRSTEAAPPPTH